MTDAPTGGTFRRRFLTHVVGICGVSVGFLVLLVGAQEFAVHRKALVHSSRTQSSMLAHTAAASLVFADAEFARATLDTLQHDERVLDACIFDAQGRLFARYARPGKSRPCPESSALGHHFDGRTLQHVQAVEYDGERVGQLSLRFTLDTLYERLRSMAMFAVLAGALSLLLALLVAARLQARLMKPVQELARTAQRVMSEKTYSVRAEQHGEDELGTLTSRFNEMLAHIEGTEGILRQQQKMEAMGTLASGVAHEINNPLMYVLGNLEWVQDELAAEGSPPKDVSEALAQAVHGAERVRDIVRELNTFTRHGGGRVQPLCPLESLRTAERMASKEVRRVAEIEYQLEDVPLVDADSGQLSQVFLNLLINAAQAMTNVQRDHHVVTLHSRTDDDGFAVLAVADTGPGIPKEALPRIFDPFFTTKPVGKGTGLGLSICHSIVQSYGGQLRVRTRPGEGTTFEVRLPPSAATSATLKNSPTDPSGGFRRLHVLLLDDDPDVMGVLRKMLAQHQTVASTSVSEALEKCRNGSFDAVLCDVMLPDESGADFHQQLIKAQPALSTRVIFMTGGIFDERLRSLIEASGQPVLYKPLQRQDLMRALAAVVDGVDRVQTSVDGVKGG